MTTFVLHSTYRTDDHNVYFITPQFIESFSEYRDYVFHESKGILERKLSLFLYDYRSDTITFVKDHRDFLYIAYDPDIE